MQISMVFRYAGEMYRLEIAKSDEKIESHRTGAFAGVFRFIHRKKQLLFLLGFLAFIYLLIKIIAINFRAISVIEFAFITIIFGFAPAYFFRKVFRFENIVGWLINSGALGILLIPFLFLIAGWLGINAAFARSVSLLYLGSIVGIVSLLFFTDDRFLMEAISFRKLGKFDLFMYAILLGYTFLLTIENFRRVFASWDAFTFWGLASKYIYQFQRLPNTTLDVFSYFKYSAFYPIYYSIIYNIYNAIREQYANWINVFINFLAITLVYNRTLGKTIIEKALVASLLIIASFSAINTLNLFSMYADILCAFLLLFYILVLTNPEEVGVRTFSKRAFLVLMLASSFFFIKSPYLVFTLALVAAWIVYDYKFILQERKSLIRRWDLWMVILTICALFFMHFSYINTHLNFPDSMAYDKLINPVLTSLSASMAYAKRMVIFLIKKNPYLLGLWIFVLCLLFLLSKRNFNSRQFIFINLVSVGIILFYSVIYILNQLSLSSGSLVRYTGIILYLFPLMVTYIPLRISPKMIWPILSLSLLIAGYFMYQTIAPTILNNNFRLSTGSYRERLAKYSNLADEILNITGTDARILITEEVEGLSFTNMYIPAIYIRYYMMTNSVGGQYMWLTREQMADHAKQYDADYILLLSYKNTFENCEDVFMNGHTYLIKLDSPIDTSIEQCPFKKGAIVDFKDQ